MPKHTLIRLAALLWGAVLLSTAPGAVATTRLDPSFGNGGLIFDGPFGNGSGGDMLLLPDGSFLVERGEHDFPVGSRNRLQRYSPLGVVDTTFGTGGTLVLPFADPFVEGLFPMARQNDGKIVVGGRKDHGSSFELTRFGPNGEPDPTFGGGTVIETVFAPLSFTALNSVTIASNGDIVAAGWGITPSNTSFIALARYRPDGTLVSTFGTGGELLIPGDFIFDVTGLFSFENGRLLVVASDRSGTLIYGLLASGALDPTFGSAGVVSDPRITATATTLDSNDRLLTASDAGVTRYLFDGSADSSFGTGGLAPASSRIFLSVRSIRVAIDGGILLTGYDFRDQTTGFLVQKIRPSGGADPDFGTSGALSVSLGRRGFGTSLLISGSRFIVSGFMDKNVGDLVYEDMFIARFADLAPASTIPSASPLALALTALALAAGAVALLRRG